MKKLLITSAVAGLSLFYSCSKESVETIDEPSSETIKLNLESFPTTNEDSATLNVVEDKVMLFESLLASKLQPGITVLESIEGAEPSVTTGIVTYKWNSEVTIDGRTYNATLTGEEIEGEMISWNINLNVGQNVNINYASGVSNANLTSVEWTINEIENDQIVFALIQYTKYSGGAQDLIYDIQTGDYAGYKVNMGYNATSNYDAYYKVTNPNSAVSEVYWNRLNGNGSVQSAPWMGNDASYCWDNSGRNTDCE